MIFTLTKAKQTKPTTSETPTVVKYSRLQQIWILVSNYIFLPSNFAIFWNPEVHV